MATCKTCKQDLPEPKLQGGDIVRHRLAPRLGLLVVVADSTQIILHNHYRLSTMSKEVFLTRLTNGGSYAATPDMLEVVHGFIRVNRS